MSFLPPQEQLEILQGSVAPVDIIEEAELLHKLERSQAENRPLIVKQGFDASAPDLHIGHAVSLWKLRTFQELGHKVVFVIGDFTGMVGDPSGKSKTRPRLTLEEVAAYAQTYREQVFKILLDDPARGEIRCNSEWHAQRTVYDLLDLCSKHTVRRMLDRDDFWQRFQAEQPISMLEFIYPLLQAYDSVALHADVELGGSDQRFNLLLVRQIQRAYRQPPEVAFLMPLLHGVDGAEKMSKSLDNAVGIADTPDDIYGKVMSISDDLLQEYFILASGLEFPGARFSAADPPQSAAVSDDLLSTIKSDPYQAKQHLARLITARYHGETAAQRAGEVFKARFQQRELPSADELRAQGNVLIYDKSSEWLPRLMVAAQSAVSNSEGMRLIKSGAVYVDGKRITADGNLDLELTKPRIVKVGKLKVFLVEVGREKRRKEEN
ncbi:MAG: tyrosine--tRNA ligase [Calditrichaeota bacterium]|nr:tyrosine--tRNA ligase [Calditrichota bacterium]